MQQLNNISSVILSLNITHKCVTNLSAYHTCC